MRSPLADSQDHEMSPREVETEELLSPDSQPASQSNSGVPHMSNLSHRRVPAVQPHLLFGTPLPDAEQFAGAGVYPFRMPAPAPPMSLPLPHVPILPTSLQMHAGSTLPPVFPMHGGPSLPSAFSFHAGSMLPAATNLLPNLQPSGAHFASQAGTSMEAAGNNQDAQPGKPQRKPKAKWEYWNTIVLIECKRAEEIENAGKKGKERCRSAEQKCQDLQKKMQARLVVEERKKTQVPLSFHKDYYDLMDSFMGKKDTITPRCVAESFDSFPTDTPASEEPAQEDTSTGLPTENVTSAGSDKNVHPEATSVSNSGVKKRKKNSSQPDLPEQMSAMTDKVCHVEEQKLSFMKDSEAAWAQLAQEQVFLATQQVEVIREQTQSLASELGMMAGSLGRIADSLKRRKE
ncbi:hypothetical protein R1sor_007604 [Riccia sorocarpa]|uniref:Uncharacterized protein n=1 Tax=Riccia sorocarpa TaxID=122646 RepID=A0ABD3HR88_9MARC